MVETAAMTTSAALDVPTSLCSAHRWHVRVSGSATRGRLDQPELIQTGCILDVLRSELDSQEESLIFFLTPHSVVSVAPTLPQALTDRVSVHLKRRGHHTAARTWRKRRKNIFPGEKRFADF